MNRNISKTANSRIPKFVEDNFRLFSYLQTIKQKKTSKPYSASSIHFTSLKYAVNEWRHTHVRILNQFNWIPSTVQRGCLWCHFLKFFHPIMSWNIFCGVWWSSFSILSYGLGYILLFFFSLKWISGYCSKECSITNTTVSDDSQPFCGNVIREKLFHCPFISFWWLSNFTRWYSLKVSLIRINYKAAETKGISKFDSSLNPLMIQPPLLCDRQQIQAIIVNVTFAKQEARRIVNSSFSMVTNASAC